MIIQTAGRRWIVELGDDGTLDTVITVQPYAILKSPRGQQREYDVKSEFRYDAEYADSFRDTDGCMTTKGLRALGLESIDQYIEESLWR